MRRHSIIARLGPKDTSRVSIQRVDSVVTEIRFIDEQKRLGFGLGQFIDQLIERGIVPSDTGIDLILLSAAVTAADTRISRDTESQDSWTREIDLYIPVQNPPLWSAESPLIERMLKFLTGDRWRIYFRERHKDYKQLIESPDHLVNSPMTSVCLFSGGLDSFAGAIDLLQAGENPVFVSHYWDISTSSQKLCASYLEKVYGDMSSKHVRARVGFPNNIVHDSGPEKTQRGRSFLFFGLAAVAASGISGTPTIYVPENGLISLNVPLDPLRVGAWSTRTTHPFYMARWQELLNHLGISATLKNPYRFKTKGEMLAECTNNRLLQKHLGETISCSSVAKARWKGLSPGHCGFCVPCLIRRASIESAFGADPTTYTVPSLTAHPLNSMSAEGEHVRSFQMMARRLSQKPGVAKMLVHKSGPLSDYSEADISSYVDVFSRGIDEVNNLVSGSIVRPL